MVHVGGVARGKLERYPETETVPPEKAHATDWSARILPRQNGNSLRELLNIHGDDRFGKLLELLGAPVQAVTPLAISLRRSQVKMPELCPSFQAMQTA